MIDETPYLVLNTLAIRFTCALTAPAYQLDLPAEAKASPAVAHAASTGTKGVAGKWQKLRFARLMLGDSIYI
eukprot:809991-Pelagomonas_calceolata.AAC.2